MVMRFNTLEASNNLFISSVKADPQLNEIFSFAKSLGDFLSSIQNIAEPRRPNFFEKCERPLKINEALYDAAFKRLCARVRPHLHMRLQENNSFSGSFEREKYLVKQAFTQRLSQAELTGGPEGLRAPNKSAVRFSPEEQKLMQANLKQADYFHHQTKNALMLIGHRGMGPSSVFGPVFADKNVLPENTIESFKRAIMLGCDGIELDIFKSKDGQIMVVHDDELWRNVYGQDRKGGGLPEGETLESYKVGQKTAAELQKLAVGPAGEKIPVLGEVFELVQAANKIRREHNMKNLIVNIEIKDTTAVNECLTFAHKYAVSHLHSGIDFNSIIFCSFNHDSLIYLQQQAQERDYAAIRVAPGVKTSALFGEQNVRDDFSVAPGSAYDQQALVALKDKVVENNFSGYDAVLWDIYKPLIKLAAESGKELHASTSDFRQYTEDTAFAKNLIKMSQMTNVFFKCDNVDNARVVLMQSCETLSGLGMQLLYNEQKGACYLYNTAAFRENKNTLSEFMPKPIAYSKLKN